MRTTVKLDSDVVAAVAELRRRDNVGLSEAINQLARMGAAVVAAGSGEEPFVQSTAALGLSVDVSNVADVLDLLDERP